jgi:hypothetical protein
MSRNKFTTEVKIHKTVIDSLREPSTRNDFVPEWALASAPTSQQFAGKEQNRYF